MQIGFARAFCDIHCVRDAVIRGDRSIIRCPDIDFYSDSFAVLLIVYPKP